MEPDLIEIFGSYMPYKITDDTWVISFMNGSEYMYLLEGNEKALLLDTGYGAGNLRAFVERLTDKPILVANTHYHPDHSAGNGEFEEVMVSENWEMDAPSLESPQGTPFDISRLPNPDYKKAVIGDGDLIDLGNRVIKVLDVGPAHCNSSLFFYDEKSEMIFVGDEFEAGQVNLFDNSNNPDAPYDVRQRLDNFKENALKIKSLRTRYILPNHNGTPIAECYLDDFIGLVDGIYSGESKIEDKLNHKYIEMDPKAPTLCRVRYGNASIFINKELLMSVYGKRD
jgi:glyoxylase-like metal-dependent hydrolase (beta-lactamase superfamily II)